MMGLTLKDIIKGVLFVFCMVVAYCIVAGLWPYFFDIIGKISTLPLFIPILVIFLFISGLIAALSKAVESGFPVHKLFKSKTNKGYGENKSSSCSSGILTKPNTLRICLILMIVILAYTVIAGAYNILLLRESTGWAIIFVLTCFIYSFLIYKIHNARSWARIVWFLFTIPGFIGNLYNIGKYSQHTAIISIIEALIYLVAFVLLWHPDTNRWFKEMSAARLEAAESTRLENTSEMRWGVDK